VSFDSPVTPTVCPLPPSRACACTAVAIARRRPPPTHAGWCAGGARPPCSLDLLAGAPLFPLESAFPSPSSCKCELASPNLSHTAHLVHVYSFFSRAFLLAGLPVCMLAPLTSLREALKYYRSPVGPALGDRLSAVLDKIDGEFFAPADVSRLLGYEWTKFKEVHPGAYFVTGMYVISPYKPSDNPKVLSQRCPPAPP
jgi:hypothetical protein